MLEQRKTYKGLSDLEEELQYLQSSRKEALNSKLNQSIYLSRFGKLGGRIEEINYTNQSSQQIKIYANKCKRSSNAQLQSQFRQLHTLDSQSPDIVKIFLKNTKLSSPHKANQQQKAKQEPAQLIYNSQMQYKLNQRNSVKKQGTNQFQLIARSKNLGDFRYFPSQNQYKFQQRLIEKQLSAQNKYFQKQNVNYNTKQKFQQLNSQNRKNKGVQKINFKPAQRIRLLQQDLMKGCKTPFRSKIKVLELSQSFQNQKLGNLQQQKKQSGNWRNIQDIKQLFFIKKEKKYSSKQNVSSISNKFEKQRKGKMTLYKYKNKNPKQKYQLNMTKKLLQISLPAIQNNTKALQQAIVTMLRNKRQQEQTKNKFQILKNREVFLPKSYRAENYIKQSNQLKQLQKSEKKKAYSQKKQHMIFQKPKYVKQIPNINMNSTQYDDSVLGWNQMRRRFLKKLQKATKIELKSNSQS